jgi:outer membrane protein
MKTTRYIDTSTGNRGYLRAARLLGAGFLLFAGPVTTAGEITERIGAYLDSIDLNDYALALKVYAAESVYTGIDDTVILYPMLLSFESSTTSDDSFFIRDANLGLRKTTASHWRYGVFTSLYTDGYGAETSAALQGMQARGWAIAAGATVGKKIGPVYADLFASTDMLNKTSGQRYDLKLAYPLTSARFQLIPQIDVARYSSDYLDYYYGVRMDEATSSRPAYSPGSGTVYTGSLHLNWRFSRSWYLHAYAAMDFLPGEITSSPIVETERALHIGIGVARDSGSFIKLDDTARAYASSLDASIEVFFMRADTLIGLEGNSLPSISLEDFNELDDRERTYPVELRWRLGRYHSLGFRYFELARDGAAELDEEIVLADQGFPAGDVIKTDIKTRVARVDYGFAFFNDPQKELIVFGGLHATDISYSVQGQAEFVAASTTVILPVVGASARLHPRERLTAAAGLEIFLLDFDQYNGQLLDISVAGEWQFNKRFAAGAGYRFYRQNLVSRDASLISDIRIDYHGPFLELRSIF